LKQKSKKFPPIEGGERSHVLGYRVIKKENVLITKWEGW